MSILRKEVIEQTAMELASAMPCEEYDIIEILDRNIGYYLDVSAHEDGDLYEV